MRTISSSKFISSLAMAGLAIMLSVPAHGRAPAGAQLVLTGVNGSLTAGSTNLSYYLNLSVTSGGVLTGKATIKGRSTVDRSKWKASFPLLTYGTVVGIDVATSDVVSIPANFQGPATLQVTLYYNGKRLAKQKLLLTIGAPVVTPAAPVTTWYDVGFNTNVTVNADGVSTNGLTPPFTYVWKITDTDVRTNATFNSTTTNAPTFTTLPITSFTNNVVSSTKLSPGIDLDKEFDLDTNPNLVGVTTEQSSLSTYHLRVIVTDAAAAAKTGTVTVISVGVSPAQPALALGQRQYFTAEPNGTNASSYSWSVAAQPSGSTAVLENPSTRTPSLRPDKEGDYVLQLKVTGGGETNSSYVTVRGATYVGLATCVSCHGLNPKVGLDDRYTPWSQTGHATMAQNGVDGILSSHYGESCFACHTLGNNKGPLAVNGGFDDVQKTLGWTFPTVLQVGNYATMPAALQNLANIQCESCHGPGSQHPGEESTSLDVAVCATCHQDGSHHMRPSQWALGPHGADDGYLAVSEEEGINPSCSKCHSAAGLVDYLEGKTPIRAEASRLVCAGCHDPHNMAKFPAEAHQVRVYDTVTLDSIDMNTGTNVVLTGQGSSAMCMQCHNARRGPFQPNKGTFYFLGGLPHESTATDVLLGLNACTNVFYVSGGVTNSLGSVTLENSAHSGVAKCVDCHMFQGSNTVGDHTFSMTDRISDEDNIAACQQCHAGVDDVTDFDHISVVRSGFPNAGNYDGTNGVQGVQTEVDGVLANLEAKMLSTGMTHSPNYPFWGGFSTNTVTKAAQRAASWNYQMIARELSHGVHNTAYTVRLLQWTYTVLSTNTGGNAYITDYPNADLR